MIVQSCEVFNVFLSGGECNSGCEIRSVWGEWTSIDFLSPTEVICPFHKEHILALPEKGVV